MDWIDFEGAVQFGKPRDWDDHEHGTCGTLPVRRTMENGLPVHDSFWRPTEAELATLLAGGAIQLSCWGIQCPVSMAVVHEVKGEKR